jgi:bifunctional UDP-N-acetylglucosamine pyrophosphorylase/glucosamine-1-phosphate N-acetyltransferase
MIIGILLAGGKGSRFKAKNLNKTSMAFLGKPLIQYGVDAYSGIVDKTFIVVGAYKDTVKAALANPRSIRFVDQKKRLGTGHAIKVSIESFKKLNLQPSHVLVGNGDHMMFYTKDILKDVVKAHVLNQNAITFITTVQENPSGLGRVIRSKNGYVQDIVEEKDATSSQRKVNEINAGFYCFNYKFLLKNYKKLTKSSISGEYYITEFIRMAIAQGQKVEGYKIPFIYVGYGINTREDFANGISLYNTKN